MKNSNINYNIDSKATALPIYVTALAISGNCAPHKFIITTTALFLFTYGGSLFISELSLISSFLAAHKYGVVDGVSMSIVPIIIYSNAETDKSKIFSDNRGRAAIYMWIHKESGKRYVGSAVNFSERMYQYFSLSWLKQVDSYITRALIHHTHSAFSLSILEYIDISNLSKEEARKLILGREQYYLDLIFSEDEPNTYNILKVAGSLLGFQHSEESIAKMAGVNNHFFGKTHSAEAKAKMSEAKLGKPSHRKGLKGLESLHKMSENNAMKKRVFVYSLDHVLLFPPFSSIKACALSLELTRFQVGKALDKDKTAKNYILVSSIKEEWNNSILK